MKAQASLLSKSPALTTGLDPFILSFLRIKVLSFREQLRFSWTEIPLAQFFFSEGWRCCFYLPSLEGRAFESGSEVLGVSR